jgi:hypothetical protein
VSIKPYILSCYTDISKKGLARKKGSRRDQKNTPGLQQLRTIENPPLADKEPINLASILRSTTEGKRRHC